MRPTRRAAAVGLAALVLVVVGVGRSEAGPAYHLIDLGTLGGTLSIGYGINDSGEVVGSAATADGLLHAFLSGPGGGPLQDLGTLGGGYSIGKAVNDSGQVVGYSTIAGGAQHAFLYSDGQMFDLNDLIPAGSGFTLISANGINDAGQITGNGITAAGATHAFLLTPVSVPEPASLLLAGIGLASVLGYARLRRRGAAPAP